jgi:hypothetical protein
MQPVFDTTKPHSARVVATLLGALAPGSYLAASHVTPAMTPPRSALFSG